MRLLLLCLALALGACDSSGEAACVAPKYPEACCCQGDVVDNPTCSGEQLVCKTGYTLYRGEECECGRNSKCCTPPPPDTGAGG